MPLGGQSHSKLYFYTGTGHFGHYCGLAMGFYVFDVQFKSQRLVLRTGPSLGEKILSSNGSQVYLEDGEFRKMTLKITQLRKENTYRWVRFGNYEIKISLSRLSYYKKKPLLHFLTPFGEQNFCQKFYTDQDSNPKLLEPEKWTLILEHVGHVHQLSIAPGLGHKKQRQKYNTY